MAPHWISAAVPDPCGLPVAFCFPRVYLHATWRPMNGTAAAQWLPAHDLFSLFKGERFLLSSSPHLQPLTRPELLPIALSPPSFIVREFSSGDLPQLFHRAPPRRDPLQRLRCCCVGRSPATFALLSRQSSSATVSPPHLRRPSTSTSCAASG
jgi:hypothetical protein